MKKVLVFGAGKGYARLKAVLDESRAEIAAIIDNNSNKWGSELDGKPVIAPEAVKQMDYDCIIITSQFFDQMASQLRQMGVSPEKILNFFSNDISQFMGHGHADIYDASRLGEQIILVNKMAKLDRSRRLEIVDGDYVRFSSLELFAEEIHSRNVAGNVAELGVYRGAFARKINYLFPDRSLYLFDTFEGFDEKDVQAEKQGQFSAPKADAFADTDVELVLKSMPHRDRCVVKKGFFPQTAEGLEDVFAFVSIDADLYQPIYEGLKYFYPRMAKGGYILIHDYNNSDYPGAKQAVRQFSEEFAVGFNPISDLCGSAVIVK